VTGLTEEDLDVLVSIAIRRAELLEDARSPGAPEAWHEVMLYEERLAEITPAAEITGGIARVGAVRAALAAGQRSEAARLASLYMADASLPGERRESIKRALQEERERRSRRFPMLARTGRLDELDEWRTSVSGNHSVFPLAA